MHMQHSVKTFSLESSEVTSLISLGIEISEVSFLLSLGHTAFLIETPQNLWTGSGPRDCCYIETTVL